MSKWSRKDFSDRSTGPDNGVFLFNSRVSESGSRKDPRDSNPNRKSDDFSPNLNPDLWSVTVPLRVRSPVPTQPQRPLPPRVDRQEPEPGLESPVDSVRPFSLVVSLYYCLGPSVSDSPSLPSPWLGPEAPTFSGTESLGL